MLLRESSLRQRLFLVFMGFVGILVASALMSWWFYQKADKLNEFNHKVENLLVEVFALYKLEQDFFTHEILTQEFYKTKKSKSLTEHHARLKKTQEILQGLSQHPIATSLDEDQMSFSAKLLKIKDSLQAYGQVFDKVVALTLQRGFIDDGLEGRVRATAHQLEDTGLYPAKLLTLRRHEKDYLYRKDTAYVQKFTDTNTDFRASIQTDRNLSNTQKTALEALLMEYQSLFQQLVRLESIIGLNYTNGKISGKRGLLRQLGSGLIYAIEDILKKTDKKILDLKKNHYQLFVFYSALMLLGSISISYLSANKITKPIENLSRIIQQNVDNRFDSPIELANTGSSREVKKLNSNFNQMLLELREYIYQIKENNHELNQQNEELNANNTKLQDSEERLSKLNSVKDKFLSIISHDLRAPLNTIVGFMKILEIDFQAFTEEEIKQFTSETQKSVNRLVNLLDNLLQWSLSETEDIKFEPEKLDLKQLLTENISLYKITAQEKEVSLKLDAQAPITVYADANMVNFILRNLLSNAIKFSEKQTSISITAQHTGQQIHLEVKDQGVGISEKNIQKIFNAEEHFSTTGTQKEKGTGFGLLLCKNFVEKNGGTIHIESKLGKGTTVSFTLPAAS